MLGAEGMHRVAEFATLNANYLMAELQKAGFTVAFPQRRASHEFIVSIKPLKDATGISAMDVAKRLLDKGFHPPTTYFPMLVPECLLIEPTETESKETLDGFVAALREYDHLWALLEKARVQGQIAVTLEMHREQNARLMGFVDSMINENLPKPKATTEGFAN